MAPACGAIHPVGQCFFCSFSQVCIWSVSGCCARMISSASFRSSGSLPYFSCVFAMPMEPFIIPSRIFCIPARYPWLAADDGVMCSLILCWSLPAAQAAEAMRKVLSRIIFFTGLASIRGKTGV